MKTRECVTVVTFYSLSGSHARNSAAKKVGLLSRACHAKDATQHAQVHGASVFTRPHCVSVCCIGNAAFVKPSGEQEGDINECRRAKARSDMKGRKMLGVHMYTKSLTKACTRLRELTPVTSSSQDPFEAFP